jgi:hypothetical protein
MAMNSEFRISLNPREVDQLIEQLTIAKEAFVEKQANSALIYPAEEEYDVHGYATDVC